MPDAVLLTVSPFPVDSSDALIRAAAFDHVRNLSAIRDHLTADDLKAGFTFNGERIPLINPRRGIFQAEADALPAFDQDRLPPARCEGLV